MTMPYPIALCRCAMGNWRRKNPAFAAVVAVGICCWILPIGKCVARTSPPTANQQKQPQTFEPGLQADIWQSIEQALVDKPAIRS
jgi:hypothetical protein